MIDILSGKDYYIYNKELMKGITKTL